MTTLAALERRAADDIAAFDYPAREWLLPGTAPEIIIAGYGQLGLMLALALRRERIDRIAIARDPIDRAGLYPALAEPPRLPRLDFAGRELSIPTLSLPAWLAANDIASIPFGPPLAALWLDYLDWLARQVGLDPLPAITALAPTPHHVTATTPSGPLAARRAVLAWSAPTPGLLPPDLTPAVANARILVQGHDAAAHDIALTCLALGADAVALLPAHNPQQDPALLSAPELVHAFALLPPPRQAQLRAAAARIPVPPPPAWRGLLAADPRAARPIAPPDADLILTPGDPIPLLDPTLIPSIDEDFALTPRLTLLAPRPDAAPGPIAHPLNLVRYAVPRVNAAISRGIFLEDADALYDAYLGFETAEGLGGRLLDDR